MKPDGKVAIVTGAGSSGPGVGTGKAISVLFAQEGARVVLVDRFADRAEETRALIEKGGGSCFVVTADLADSASFDRIASATVDRYGRIDIVVNNAAITLPAGILDTTPEQYADVVAINLTAPFMMTKAVLPTMVAGGGGSIVNVTSIAALRGQGGRGATACATAKSGLLGLTTDVADAFGTQGIRVNLVAPGIIDTPMRNAVITRAGGNPDTLDLTSRTCLGIEGDAWDIARAALFPRRPRRPLHHRRAAPGRRRIDLPIPLADLRRVTTPRTPTPNASHPGDGPQPRCSRTWPPSAAARLLRRPCGGRRT
jgi:NAD(P)-dependent dehydrogenase (short-subunit alcohol dehydrogenase family)